jgi:hypothetical protein
MIAARLYRSFRNYIFKSLHLHFTKFSVFTCLLFVALISIQSSYLHYVTSTNCTFHFVPARFSSLQLSWVRMFCCGNLGYSFECNSAGLQYVWWWFSAVFRFLLFKPNCGPNTNSQGVRFEYFQNEILTLVSLIQRFVWWQAGEECVNLLGIFCVEILLCKRLWTVRYTDYRLDEWIYTCGRGLDTPGLGHPVVTCPASWWDARLRTHVG